MSRVEGARFGHVNVTTHDWRRLADFYGEVFGLEPFGAERDIASPEFDRAVGLSGAHLRGIHLKLPGHEPGPTIEIYAYDEMAQEGPPAAVNRAGWGHIAFQVPDVVAAVAAVVAAGGSAFGDIVTTSTKDGRRVMWCYTQDPDGNLLELQAWLDA